MSSSKYVPPVSCASVLVLLVVSLLVRLYLAPLLAFAPDMQLNLDFGTYAAAHGVTSVPDVVAGTPSQLYPPLFYYQDAVVSRLGAAQLAALDASYPAVGAVWERVRLKLLFIVYDLITGIVILMILRRLAPPPWPLIGAAAYLLNPCIFINSAWVGQLDCIHSLFLLGCVLCVWKSCQDRERWLVAAWGLYALAVGTKLQSIVLLPLLLTITWMRRNKPLALAGPLFGAVCGLVVLSPFLLAGRWDYFPRVFVNSFKIMALTQDNAFNVWAFMLVKPASTTVLGVSYAHIGQGLYLLAVVWLCAALVSAGLPRAADSETLRRLCVAAAYACVAPFMTLTAMHERYVAPAIPFIVLAACLDTRLRWLAVGLSAVYTLNLLYVLRPSVLPPDELAIRNAGNFALRVCGSLLNVGMFGWFTVRLPALLASGPERLPGT
jgi:Gpi18-like mannosyltransferase